jgi:hypothetical protein
MKIIITHQNLKIFMNFDYKDVHALKRCYRLDYFVFMFGNFLSMKLGILSGNKNVLGMWNNCFLEKKSYALVGRV